MNSLVSVVIPAYNEEKNVPAVYQAVRSSLAGCEPCEIIFVDDGSTDATAERVRGLRAQDSCVRLIRFGRNFGQQPALLAGLEAARGAAVITLDCDLQHPPELLPRMIQAWRNGAQVVQMVRMQTAGVGFLKTLTSRLFYRFVNLLSETPVVSGAADYQLLDRAVVDAVLRFRDRYPFLRGLVGWLGFPATRIEYVALPRHTGTSGYTLRKMLRLSLQAVMGLSSKPLRFSFYFGLLTAVFCVVRRIRRSRPGGRQGRARVDIGNRDGYLSGRRTVGFHWYRRRVHRAGVRTEPGCSTLRHCGRR
jgi:glycosyltransferase involved in cell wall biosynthesis